MRGFRQEIRFAAAADGAKIAFATSGKGYPLLRAAHWMTHVEWDWQMPPWAPWLEALSSRFHLVRYDSRGCGLSDRDVPAMDLEQLVLDLEAVADTAGLERFALLGMSQGGAAAITYAARHPERVTHLVLLDAYSRGVLVRDNTRATVIQAMGELMLAGWGQGNPAFRQMFTTQFFPRAAPALADAFNDLQRLSCTPEHASRLLHALARVDASTSLPLVRCPALILHCRGDTRVEFEEGRFIARAIPSARFEPLESDNHCPLEGEPAFSRALEIMDEFLPRQEGSSSSFPGLTVKQREFIELLARGLDNAQIGAHLGLAEKTVRNNVSTIFTKLGVENRAQAIVRAREAGFGR